MFLFCNSIIIIDDSLTLTCQFYIEAFFCHHTFFFKLLFLYLRFYFNEFLLQYKKREKKVQYFIFYCLYIAYIIFIFLIFVEECKAIFAKYVLYLNSLSYFFYTYFITFQNKVCFGWAFKKIFKFMIIGFLLKIIK